MKSLKALAVVLSSLVMFGVVTAAPASANFHKRHHAGKHQHFKHHQHHKQWKLFKHRRHHKHCKHW